MDFLEVIVGQSTAACRCCGAAPIRGGGLTAATTVIGRHANNAPAALLLCGDLLVERLNFRLQAHNVPLPLLRAAVGPAEALFELFRLRRKAAPCRL